MYPILFHVGPFTLHTYGLLLAAGFMAAFYVARSTFAQQGLAPERLDEFAFLCLIAGLVGARVLYFAVDGFKALRADPLSFFRIWEGGLVYYGGFLAAVAAVAIYCRKVDVRFLAVSDAFAGPLLLGQGIGRLGCFSAGCCYGRPTHVPWAVTFTDPRSLAPLGVPIHPTQLYEFAGDIVLFFLYLALAARRPRRGVLTAYYLMAYAALRFFIEILRGDDRGVVLGGLQPSQWIALGAFGVGSVVLFYAHQKNQTKAAPGT